MASERRVVAKHSILQDRFTWPYSLEEFPKMGSSIIAVMQPSDSIEGENTTTDRAASSRPGVP